MNSKNELERNNTHQFRKKEHQDDNEYATIATKDMKDTKKMTS